MVDEKRKFVRIKTALFVQYCLKEDEGEKSWDIVNVKDVGENGICILTGKPVLENSIVHLRIKIPSRPFEPLQIDGKVVFSVASESGNFYTTRVAFQNMKDDERSTLRSFIDWVIKNKK